MLSTFVVLVLMILYCVLHSYTASDRMKSRVRDRFGPETDRWYRLAFNIFSVLSFIPVVLLLRIMQDKLIYFIRFPWAIIALIIQSLGFILLLYGLQQTGVVAFFGLEPLLLGDQSSGKSGFVRTGVYGWVRHPLYLGGILIIWPAASMTVNLLVFLVICTIYFYVGARLEEKRYVEEFGEEYIKYQQEVPMMIPKLGRLIKLVGNRES